MFARKITQKITYEGKIAVRSEKNWTLTTNFMKQTLIILHGKKQISLYLSN